MQKIVILNSREIREIKEILVEQFGYALPEDYAYLQTEKDKIFLITKDLVKLDLDKLIVDKLGLYFAEINHGEVRLSKEGAQLLGDEARKNKVTLLNVVPLSAEEMKKYFAGENLIKDLGPEKKLVLLKFESNIFGCAKYKEGEILNYLPKNHRGEVII